MGFISFTSKLSSRIKLLEIFCGIHVLKSCIERVLSNERGKPEAKHRS